VLDVLHGPGELPLPWFGSFANGRSDLGLHLARRAILVPAPVARARRVLPRGAGRGANCCHMVRAAEPYEA
jgi:hypothetical protein